MCPLFAEDVHAHLQVLDVFQVILATLFGFAWTLSVSTGALSGGCCLTMPPEPSWQDGSLYQLDG